jgi:hypothetical protein
MVLLSPNTQPCLKKGLTFLAIQFEQKSEKQNTLEFCQHYGSAPLDLAKMWYDLMVTDIPEVRMDDKDKSGKSSKMFMITHFWLWTYPKNSNLMASWFKSCKRYLRGEPFRKWIKRIAALKAKKIVWDASLDDTNTAVLLFQLMVHISEFGSGNTHYHHVTTDNAQRSSTMVLLSTRLRSLCLEQSVFTSSLVPTEEGSTTWRCFARVVSRRNWCVTRKS